MRDSSLERIIDEVARSLTAMDVPPAVRARVREQITGLRGQPTAWMWRAAVAAASLAVVWLGWTAAFDDGRTATGRRAAAHVSPAPAAVRTAETVSPSGGAADRMSAPSVPPLPRPEPIAVERMSLEPLATPVSRPEASLHVQPLEPPMPLMAERLTLEPLFIE